MHELTIDPASTLNVAPAYFKPQYDKILGSKSSCFTPAQGAAKLANGCVNPWDVEHEPNSTIFPHLRETAIAGPSRSVEPDQMANCVPLAVGKGSNTRDSELVSPVAGLRPFWQPEWIHSCIGSTADIEMSEFPGSEATLPSSSSTATGDTSRVNSPVTGDTSRVDSPVTSTSSVSLAKEGKGIKIRPGSPVDIVNYAVVTPHDSKIESAASAEFAFPHDIMAASPQGVPPIRQTLLCNVASHVCEKCDLSFRTRGQLKNHDNRKHNLRFKCIFCTAAFGLRADLERHKITRHIDDLCQKPLKVFRCPVSGCPTSEKEYFRKDNFHKHMRRCSKAREKAKAKQEVSQSPD